MNEPSQIAELLEQRRTRRRKLAKLSFEEKMEIIERLRALQHNRSLMRDELTGEQFDEYVRPEKMTHP